MPINYYKFYTIDNTALLCYKAIKRYVKINKDDLIIEPSAGNGAFIKYLKKLSNNTKFYDIKPEHKDIKKHNFFKVKNVKSLENALHIIGNPPFGNKSSLAIKFIKHAALLNAKTIAFILPISFNKNSFKKSFPQNYHLKYTMQLPENSYTYKNKLVNIKTIFQIWEKRDYNRKLAKKIKPNSWYKFVKKENSNIAIRRVGFSTGKAKKSGILDNRNTNWFIKVKKQYVGKIINSINKITFNFKNNVGAFSISKQDIIKKLNKINIK